MGNEGFKHHVEVREVMTIAVVPTFNSTPTFPPRYYRTIYRYLSKQRRLADATLVYEAIHTTFEWLPLAALVH